MGSGINDGACHTGDKLQVHISGNSVPVVYVQP